MCPYLHSVTGTITRTYFKLWQFSEIYMEKRKQTITKNRQPAYCNKQLKITSNSLFVNYALVIKKNGKMTNEFYIQVLYMILRST